MKHHLYPYKILAFIVSFLLLAPISLHAQQNKAEDWTWLDGMDTRQKEWKRIDRHYPVEETYWVHSWHPQYKVYRGDCAFQDGKLKGVSIENIEELCGERIDFEYFTYAQGGLKGRLIAFVLSQDFNENKYEVESRESANVLKHIRKKLFLPVPNDVKSQGRGVYKGVKREENDDYRDEERAKQYIKQLLQDHAGDDNHVSIERISGTKFRVFFSTVEAEVTFTATKERDVKYDVELIAYIDNVGDDVDVEDETCADASDYRVKYFEEDETVGNVIVERQACYPGGEAALMKHISENLVYPQSALENGVQGIVTLKFMVGKDGSVQDVRIVRGVSMECDAAAKAAVKKLSRFTPAMQGGKPVRVWFTLPIRFRLP